MATTYSLIGWQVYADDADSWYTSTPLSRVNEVVYLKNEKNSGRIIRVRFAISITGDQQSSTIYFGCYINANGAGDINPANTTFSTRFLMATACDAAYTAAQADLTIPDANSWRVAPFLTLPQNYTVKSGTVISGTNTTWDGVSDDVTTTIREFEICLKQNPSSGTNDNDIIPVDLKVYHSAPASYLGTVLTLTAAPQIVFSPVTAISESDSVAGAEAVTQDIADSDLGAGSETEIVSLTEADSAAGADLEGNRAYGHTFTPTISRFINVTQSITETDSVAGAEEDTVGIPEAD